MSKTKDILGRLSVLSAKSKDANKQYFSNLNKRQKRDLDNVVHELHQEVFAETDCLECANCCKSLGPRIIMKDIERIAKSQRMKESDFVEKYLRIDEDGDYVFKSMPCPFLASDNYCLIYDFRPKACREYPHTDRTKFLQIANLTITNSATCPAVYEILERLRGMNR